MLRKTSALDSPNTENQSIDNEPLTIDITESIQYYDHNRPVTVVLPPEAANAQEIDMPNS